MVRQWAMGSLLMVSFLASGQAFASDTEDWVTFGLTLPTETRLVETVTITQGIEWGDGQQPETTQRATSSDIRIQRHDQGFSVTVKPRNLPQAQTESTTMGSVVEALRGLKLVYRFDMQGHLLALDGLEVPVEELIAAIPPAMRPMIEAMLPAAMEQIRDEWRSRYLDLVGKRFRVGYTGRGTVPMTLSPGTPPVPVQMAIGVGKRLPCVPQGPSTCVLFSMGFLAKDTGTSGERMSAMLREWLSQIVLMAQPKTPKAQLNKLLKQMPTLKISDFANHVDRVVDPATLTVYGETMVRSFLAVTEDGTRMQWIETAERRFVPASQP